MIALVGVVVVAISYRLSFFSSDVMPILDGGMFYEFIRAVAENGLRFPSTATYNQVDLPFAYPPLAFWVGAWLHTTFDIEILQLLRVYPFTLHLVYLGMMIPLWRGFGLPWSGALIAFAIAIMIYQSFEWLIMGGGLTRATGAALAVSAGAAAAWSMRLSRRWLLVLAGVLAGLALLTHLLWGTLSVMICTAAVLTLGTSWKQRFRALMIGALVVLAMVTPWLAWVVSQHGFAPFANSSAAGMRGTHQFYLTARALIFPSFLTYFCIIGVWECLRRKAYVWPALTLAIMVLTPRNYWNMALLSNATLAAIGVMSVWGWITDRIGEIRRDGATPNWVPKVADWSRAWVPMVLAAGWTFFGSQSDIINSIMSSMKDEQLEAMDWVNETLPENTNMLVISYEAWFDDEVSEWLPVLTHAKSLGTVQSTEWLPEQFFEKQQGKVGHLRGKFDCPQLVDTIEKDWWRTEYLFVVADIRCLPEDPRLIEVYQTPKQDADGDARRSVVWIYKVDLIHGAD